MSDGLLYGRGIADNIGPFTQRLICIEEQIPDVGLLFVIQGEEEIGSPGTEIYPKLEHLMLNFGLMKQDISSKMVIREFCTLVKMKLLIESTTLSLKQIWNTGLKLSKKSDVKGFWREQVPLYSTLAERKALLGHWPQ